MNKGNRGKKELKNLECSIDYEGASAKSAGRVVGKGKEIQFLLW